MCIYDIYGPCSCPHGRCYTILAQAFAVGSFVTSTMALTSCFYVSVRPIPLENEIEFPKEGFGWLSRQMKVMEPPSYGQQCVFYSSNEREQYFDSMWNSGFAMALISVVLGSIAMSIILCTCCVAFEMRMFDGLFWTCMICFVAQALTFLSWGSTLCTGELDMECSWASGTGMNLSAAMMWIWAANMVKSFPEALPPPKRNRNKNKRNDGNNDDDDGMGDVYLNNRNDRRDGNANDEDEYYDEYDDQYDGDGDGYYDDDGNWIENEYNTDQGDNNENSDEYEGYDDYDGGYSGAVYDDYDNNENSDEMKNKNDDDDSDDDSDDSSSSSEEEVPVKKSKKSKKKT